MRLVIEVELGNDAMVSPADVVGAIEASVRRNVTVWDDGPLSAGDEGRIRDGNGNSVGKWEVTA